MRFVEKWLGKVTLFTTAKITQYLEPFFTKP